MKSFLKYVLATITGTLIVGIILFFIFFGIISAFVSLAKQDKTVEIKKQSILMLNLDKQIYDRKPSAPLFRPSFTSLMPESALGLNELLANIKKAGNDANIEGIFLNLSSIQAGIGTIEEIRNALKEFRDSGKFVISYSDYYNQSSYYLASISDKIYMNPVGVLYLKGLRAELMFFQGAFNKLGIEPQIIRHGKFKSAVEPLINKSMSEENRIQIKAYMGSIWNHIVDNISSERQILPSMLNSLADKLELSDPQAAYDNNLIDSLIYKDEVMEILKEKTGISGKKKPNIVTFSDYTKVPKQREQKGLIKEKIAVIYAQGDIVPGKGEYDEIGADLFADAISEARKDSAIKAIVLRINSPGGSALASEIIWREVDLARRVKPVITSMGDYAASGGYYIACPADIIVVNPLTLTGSIGVFGVWWNAEEFFENKLGITADVEKTNTYSDFGTVFRPFTSYETAVLQKSVDNTYNTFVNHVSQGRELPYTEINKIGEGRVWSGINAVNLGLADSFGGLNDAIKIAAEQAGLDLYRVVELPKQENPLDKLIKELMGGVNAKIIKNELGENYRYYQLLDKAMKMNGVQARLPFSIVIQ